jgi:hypothetical protein
MYVDALLLRMAQIIPVTDRDDVLPEYRSSPLGLLLE